MHNFEYKENARKLLTPEIVNLLGSIYEHKGRQQLFVEAKNDELSSLLEIAKIQSTKSSNRIEGIFTTDYEPADDCKALKVQIENVIDLIENDKNFKASLVCVGEMFRRRYSIDRFVDDIYKVLTE